MVRCHTRRGKIQNDSLKVIVALPLDMFYNTRIGTYLRLLANRKPEHRGAGFSWSTLPIDVGPSERIQGRGPARSGTRESPRSPTYFPNSGRAGKARFLAIRALATGWCRSNGRFASEAAEIRALRTEGKRSKTAPPVIREIHKRKFTADSLHGLFGATINGRPVAVEYEPDTALCDTERVPLQESGGIDALLWLESLADGSDTWFRAEEAKIGCQANFIPSCKPWPVLTLEENRAEILALELALDKEHKGLLTEIIGGSAAAETRR